MSTGDSLDYRAVTAQPDPKDSEAAAMRHFHSLSREQQADAIRRLAATGMSEVGIARATRLSIERVRRVVLRP